MGYQRGKGAIEVRQEMQKITHDLYAKGWSARAIGKVIRLSYTVVAQILNGKDKHEK
tara:strand:- start:792 stop:962 length:171 start_codon:yes stop_codon:yes gene_type:complete